MLQPVAHAAEGSHRLSRDEVVRFHLDGYAGPFRAVAPEAMEPICRHLFADVFPTDGPNPRDRTHSRHLDTPAVFGLVSHAAIVGRIASVLGDDVMVWTTGFFIKQPRDGLETPWHQDINYWPLEPQVNITIWLAIEDVLADGSPLLVIPGSHRRLLPHTAAPPGKAFAEEADPRAFSPAAARALTMRAGEFVMFSERLLHHAPPNRSARRRTALAARYTMPQVKLFPEEPPIDFPGYHAILVRGQDRFALNPLGPPPSAAPRRAG